MWLLVLAQGGCGRSRWASGAVRGRQTTLTVGASRTAATVRLQACCDHLSDTTARIAPREFFLHSSLSLRLEPGTDFTVSLVLKFLPADFFRMMFVHLTCWRLFPRTPSPLVRTCEWHCQRTLRTGPGFLSLRPTSDFAGLSHAVDSIVQYHFIGAVPFGCIFLKMILG